MTMMMTIVMTMILIITLTTIVHIQPSFLRNLMYCIQMCLDVSQKFINGDVPKTNEKLSTLSSDNQPNNELLAKGELHTMFAETINGRIN
jgi:hypothetical protein